MCGVLELASAVNYDQHAIASSGSLGAGGERAGDVPGVALGCSRNAFDNGGAVGNAIGGWAAAEDETDSDSVGRV